MLKGFVTGLRRAGLLPRQRHASIIILHHDPADATTPGDVSFFVSAEALAREGR